MSPYVQLAASSAGSIRIAKGLTCEDYAATFADGLASIVLASDGHGDPSCFRSARGARIACDTAGECLREFCAAQRDADPAHDSFRAQIRSLENRVAEFWRQRVLADAQERPFTQKELAGATEEARIGYERRLRLENAYGCTLVAAAITSRWWLALQIGDGRLVAAYPDGVYVDPVPPDPECVGNRTSSLCDPSAPSLFRHFCSRTLPSAAFACSDGLEESFDTAGLHSFLSQIGHMAQNRTDGRFAARIRLLDLLPQISAGGSGDDVCLAMAVSANEMLAKPRPTMDDVYEKVSAQARRVEQCEARLAELQRRLDDVRDQAARRTAGEGAESGEFAPDELQLAAQVTDLRLTLARARNKSRKAVRYLEQAERFWSDALERIGLLPAAIQPSLGDGRQCSGP